MRRLHRKALIALVFTGCYAHDARSRRPEDTPKVPSMIAPSSGRYLITRGGEHVGEERFTITSSGAVWRVEGTIEMAWPVEQTQRYALEIDEKTREPIAFEISMDLAGEHQHATGKRDEEFFEVHINGIAGEHHRQIPYGQGTVIDFGSPLFNTLALTLLVPTMKMHQPIAVRALVVSLPALEPAVMVQMYELKGTEGEMRMISIRPVGGTAVIGMWVREDGMPVRVRSSVERGLPFDMRLVGTATTSG